MSLDFRNIIALISHHGTLRLFRVKIKNYVKINKIIRIYFTQ